MGGSMGHGPVLPEADEPPFHASWEARALGITLAVGALGHWTLDESRHARESLPWADYLTLPYYAIWLAALERLIDRHSLLANAPNPHPRRLTAAVVPPMLARGGPTERPGPAPAFLPGDVVRARNLHPRGHTRLPGYARGRVGRIVACHGAHVFPDTNAHGAGEAPRSLYTVAFTGEALWGPDAEPGTVVHLDLWEPYLDRA